MKSFDAMPPDAIARTLLFDAMLADRARVIRPVIVVSPQTFAVESHGAKSIPGPVTRAQTPSPSPNWQVLPVHCHRTVCATQRRHW